MDPAYALRHAGLLLHLGQHNETNTKQHEQEEAASQEQRPGHDRLRRIMERITRMPVVSDTTASPKILRPVGSVNSTPM